MLHLVEYQQIKLFSLIFVKQHLLSIFMSWQHVENISHYVKENNYEKNPNAIQYFIFIISNICLNECNQKEKIS